METISVRNLALVAFAVVLLDVHSGLLHGQTLRVPSLTRTSLGATRGSERELLGPRVPKSLDSITVAVVLRSGWNFVSNPVISPNDSIKYLYPQCGPSCAFWWIIGSGYVSDCRLPHGRGAVLRCGGGTAYITGQAITRDSIAVVSGWNLIGSISFPVDVSTIVSDPPGIRLSEFFGFDGTYVVADSIRPGYGYWVKVSSSGKLIMAASAASRAMRR